MPAGDRKPKPSPPPAALEILDHIPLTPRIGLVGPSGVVTLFPGGREVLDRPRKPRG